MSERSVQRVKSMSQQQANSEPQSTAHRWYPYLIALFPAANLYVANSSAVELVDLFLPVGAVMAVTFVVHLVARRLLGPGDKAAILTSWSLGIFFCYGLLEKLLGNLSQQMLGGNSVVRGEYVLSTWGIIWLAGAIWIARTSRNLLGIGNFLQSMSVILLLICVGQGLLNNGASEQAPSSQDSASWVPQPVELRPGEAPPDIYFFIFDRYACEETLTNHFQLDTSDFLAGLRSRGLKVIDEARANYPRTVFSMCSTLNLNYLPSEIKKDSYYSRLIDDHLVGRTLREAGYEYHHLGNWYQPLRSSKNANSVIATSKFPSEFADSLYAATPLTKLMPARDKVTFLGEKFARIAEIARDSKPTFTYAHFMLPHRPYVLDENGERISWRETRYGDRKQGYVNQLKGTNKLILQTIDDILEHAERPPIIVLQSDEGPYLNDDTRDLERVEQINFRTRVFSAYYLPENAAGSVPEPPISSVNTFRFLFREYFDATLDLLPNRVFYWEHADSSGLPSKADIEFVEVTEQVD